MDEDKFTKMARTIGQALATIILLCATACLIGLMFKIVWWIFCL